MGIFITSNRYTIKRYLSELFDLTAERKFEEMHDVVDLLKSEIFKYCTLMDLDFSIFEEILEDVAYDLGYYAGRSHWRQEALRGHLKILHDKLTQHQKKLPLYQRLCFISEDLDRNLSLLFTKEGALRDDVLDGFTSLQDLSSELREQCSFETYQLYRQTMKSAAAVKPYLPLESPDVDTKGRVLVRPNEIKDLRSRTSPFLATLSDLIAIFHQPSPPAKEKDNEEKAAEDKKEVSEDSTLADVDELRRHQLFLESVDLITRQGWTWTDTARHLNITCNELLDIWGLEEIPTIGDTVDHEENEPDEKTNNENSKKLDEVEKAKTKQTNEENEDDA